jgi:hypothetical protein
VVADGTSWYYCRGAAPDAVLLLLPLLLHRHVLRRTQLLLLRSETWDLNSTTVCRPARVLHLLLLCC